MPLDARKAFQRQLATPSDYIARFDSLKPGTPVVLVARKSSREKTRISKQAYRLLAAAIAAGLVVVRKAVGKPFSRVWPGRDPIWLVPVVAIAKKYDAVIVAESTSRLIRSQQYDKEHQKEQPDQFDFRELLWVADGVKLVTLLDPDATFEEERAFQSSRPITAGPGRPHGPHGVYRPRLTHREEQRILELRAAGNSVPRITRSIVLLTKRAAKL